MIKLATVFSGIGAIEHALDRMQLEHEIVFACDNGDVELELPKVSIDIDSMENELKELKEIVKKVSGQIKDEENWVAMTNFHATVKPIADIRSTAEYRRWASGRLVRDALENL